MLNCLISSQHSDKAIFCFSLIYIYVNKEIQEFTPDNLKLSSVVILTFILNAMKNTMKHISNLTELSEVAVLDIAHPVM